MFAGLFFFFTVLNTVALYKDLSSNHEGEGDSTSFSENLEDQTKLSFSDIGTEIFCPGISRVWSHEELGDDEGFVPALISGCIGITCIFWPTQERILARNPFVFALMQFKRLYQNAEGSLKAQQSGDKAAHHPSGTGNRSALQSQTILIWILLNSSTKTSNKFKIPDWLTNTMHCSFFTAQRAYSHTRDFFLFPEHEIKSQLPLLDKRLMTAERLCWWQNPYWEGLGYSGMCSSPAASATRIFTLNLFLLQLTQQTLNSCCRLRWFLRSYSVFALILAVLCRGMAC